MEWEVRQKMVGDEAEEVGKGHNIGPHKDYQVTVS